MASAGIEYEILPESVAYVRRGTPHSLKATGIIMLKFMVIISATGLEKCLKQMGKARLAGSFEPESFDSGSAPSGHGVKR